MWKIYWSVVLKPTLLQRGSTVVSNPCPLCKLKSEKNYTLLYTVSITDNIMLVTKNALSVCPTVVKKDKLKPYMWSFYLLHVLGYHKHGHRKLCPLQQPIRLQHFQNTAYLQSKKLIKTKVILFRCFCCCCCNFFASFYSNTLQLCAKIQIRLLKLFVVNL